MKSESSLFRWKEQCELRFVALWMEDTSLRIIMKTPQPFQLVRFSQSYRHHYFQINWILWKRAPKQWLKHINGFLVEFHQFACAMRIFSRNYTFRKSDSARNYHCCSCKHVGLSIFTNGFFFNSKNMALNRLNVAPKCGMAFKWAENISRYYEHEKSQLLKIWFFSAEYHIFPLKIIFFNWK